MKIEQLYEIYKQYPHICIDTRKITQNCIFFALKGANFNGNEFAEKALENGAKYVVIDEIQYQKDEHFLLVEDVLTSLQKLANYHRHQLKIPFIGLTGSNGKTTTKELITNVLSKKYKTYSTKGNFNNHIGVPLTLLSIPQDAEMAVIEMGANHQGEIEFLCNIAEPSHGLITNVGKAHLEGFGGFEGVKKGKSEIYKHLLKTNGTVFVNAQNPHLMEMITGFEKPIFYLKEDGFLNIIFKEASPFIVYETTEGEEIKTQIIGAYNFENIAVALCIGKYFDVPAKSCHEAIKEYVSENNRSQVMQREKNTILMDAYNANPSSMEVALKNFNAMNAKNKVLILGDMFELGENSQEEHQKIVETALLMDVQKIIFYGKEFFKVQKNAPNALFFAEKEDLLNFLKEYPLENTYCLIKGSRGSKLEDVLSYIG